MRFLGALLLMAGSLSAQFGEFAVTDDGQLYFSSTLMAGSAKDISLKVYRWTDHGPELFATGGGGDNPFGPTASTPLVSGNGSITGYAIGQPCASGSCGLAGGPRTQFQLQGAGFTNVPYYFLQVSRNGRYFLGIGFSFHTVLTELPSQRSTDLGMFAWAGPQAVADTGSALMLDPSASTVLYRPLEGEARKIEGAENVLGAALSPLGDRIAYERKREGAYELVLTDPSGSTHRVLASGATQLPYGYQPRFANDGTLFYIDRDQQAAVVPPGGDPKRLAKIDAGVQRAIPSGDGRIAWLESDTGQLLRVQMANGAVEEVLPATPYGRWSADVAFPGSVLHFAGTGVNRTTRFRAADTSLPLSALEEDGAAVQIPWEHTTNDYQEVVTIQGDGNPFVQRINYFPLGLPSIAFERESFSRTLKAAHQDWRGPISDTDPAAPGETIHVFARNMGPVDRPVATGQPSPDPPARVTTPFACYLFEVEGQTGVRPQGLVVPFAGLSSGLIGIYHIDVTIPSDWAARDAMLQCRMDNGGTLYSGDDARITVGAR